MKGVFPVKHFRILLPLLILALIASGCGNTAREPYDYHYNGKTLKVYPESATIVDGLNVYRYTMQETNRQTYYEIVYPNGAATTGPPPKAAARAAGPTGTTTNCTSPATF